jgi:hypothetical protein
LTRLIAGALLVPIALLALVLVAAVAALHNLDHPRLKPLIVSRLEADTGLRLDYQTARVAVFSGLRLEGLVVHSPPPFHAVAPEALRIGSLEVDWSLGSLLGEPARVGRVTARDVAVVLVADDAGPTSLAALMGPEELEPAEPPLGVSQQAAAFLASAPPFGKVEVSALSFSHLRVRNGEVLERWSLRGFAATIEAKQQDAAWKVLANTGRLPLELSREGPALPSALAQLELLLSAEVGASAAHLSVDLDAARQTFEPLLTVRALLHGKASASFDGDKRHTTLELERTQLLDSAEVQARVVLPDAEEVPPVVTQAVADLDLGRLLNWLPASWRPFSLERGKLRLDAQDITLSDMPRLGAQGRLGLEVDVAALQLARDALRVALGDGHLTLVATPDAQEGLAARLAFSLQGLDVAGPTALRIPKASGELKGQRLRTAPYSPLRVAGDVTLSGMVEALDVRASGLRATAQRLGFQLHAPVADEPPFALKADVPVGALQVLLADGREAFKGPVRAKLDVSEAFPPLDGARARARARLQLDAGTLHASLDATPQGNDALAYTLAFRTPDLVAARPFIPDPVAARIPWRHLAVDLTSTGRLAALASASPRLEHRTELRLRKPAWNDVSATSVALVMQSKGDAWRHQGELVLQAEGLRAGEQDLGPQHQTLTLDVDRRKPSLRLGLTSQAGLKVALDAALAFDRKARALRCDVKGNLPPLGALSPLLARARIPPELETSKLEASFELHGSLHGVFTGFAADGTPLLAPAPLRTASFEGTSVAEVRGIRWRQEAWSLILPAVRWQGESRAEGPRRILHSRLTSERLSLGLSDRRLSFHDISSDTTATFTGEWEAGELEVKHLVKARALEHKPALPYPLQDLEWSFSGRRKPNGVIHIPDLKVSIGTTSTRLTADSRFDFSDGRRRLTIQGELEQDLARLAQPGVLESSGKVKAGFQVASPNLVVYRTHSNLLLQDVNVRMPGPGIEVLALDGSVPLTQDLELTQDGVRHLGGIDVNPYSMLRFADQHPMMSRSGFMSAARITTPQVSLAPVAGNLSINQHLFFMNQLEMGVRGGRITGQCVLDWQGKHSTLEARVRATGVQSSRGEPFDGNAAMVISGKDRSINGRAEIVRIGNRHLLDLLDLQDPHHADAATNRIRYALGFGYPEHVRMSFNHGFGRVSIGMGGPARLIRIDEIRGIAMGPIVDSFFNSLSLAEATP